LIALPRLPTIQIAAMLATWLLFETYESRQAVVLVWAIGFSHYLLGLIYSRKQVAHVISSTANLLPTGLLLVGGTLFYFLNGSLTYYFVLHHALNETYLSIRFQSHTLSTHLRSRIQSVSFSLQLFGALILVSPWSTNLGTGLFLTLFFCYSLLLAYYLYTVYALRSHFKSAPIVSIVFTEIALLFLIPIDHWIYNISLYHLVLYHFAFWIIFPASGQQSRGLHGQLLVYMLATVISLWLFISLAPLEEGNLLAFIGRYQLYEFWFLILSYVHITLAFSISSANPAWILRLLRQPDRSAT